MAMTTLGSGLTAAEHHEEALSVKEADLAMERRLGVSEESILVHFGGPVYKLTHRGFRRFRHNDDCFRRGGAILFQTYV